MIKVHVTEELKTLPTRPNFSYRGMNQVLLDTLRSDSNFGRSLTEILVGANLMTSLDLLVTGQGRPGEAVEGISLVSYNRFSVDIAYCESGVHGLGTAHVQIECPGNVGAARDLFEKLRASGVPGGEAGCTAEPERTFVTRHSLAGQYVSREKPEPPKPVDIGYIRKSVPIKTDVPKKNKRANSGEISLKDAITQTVEILSLGRESKAKFLSGSVDTRTINAAIASLTQKGHYNLALILSKGFLS